MTFRGSVANINIALNGLTYTPTANHNGGAILTLSTVDSALVTLNIDTTLKGRYTFDNPGTLGQDTSPAVGYPGAVSGATSVVDGTRGTVLKQRSSITLLFVPLQPTGRSAGNSLRST